MEDDDVEMKSTTQVRELMSLVSLLSSSGEGHAEGAHRHVNPGRLLQIVERLNLKSILFSPLECEPRPKPRNTSLGIRHFLLSDTVDPLSSFDRDDRSFDLALMSLSHMWSVCGHRYLDHEQTITPCPTYCGMIDSTGRYAITGADDSLVKIWDVAAGKLVATLSGHTAEICDIAFSHNSEYIASLCTEDMSVIIWKRLENHLYVFQRKLSESDPNDVSRRLSPLYMSFTPEEPTPAIPQPYLKLVIAYTNSTVVIHEFVNDNIIEYNRVKPFYENVELKSFAVVHPTNPPEDTVRFLIGVNRPSSGSIKSVLHYSARSRGIPKIEEFKFPNASKSSIVHIAVANSSRSFLAADDEISTVVLYRELPDKLGHDQPQVLFKSFVAGDATLGYDQSSLLRRLREFCPSHEIVSGLRISTDIAIFTVNDEFILCTIAGNPRDSETLGEDDASSIYCCLVFLSETCQLVGVIGLGKNRDNLFNVCPIKAPVGSSTNASYFGIGGHDGLFTIYKIYLSGRDFFVIQLTEFQIDERGSNRPRMILDCAVLEKPDGELLAMITDAKGTITMFSSLHRSCVCPSEQFFHNDYIRAGQAVLLGTAYAGIEVGGGRTTTAENGGVICDSRLVPLSELQVLSPDHIPRLIGSGFSGRFGEKSEKFIYCFTGQESTGSDTNQSMVVNVPQNHVPAPVVATNSRPGRPPLSEQERQRRAESLRNLAAARAAQTIGDSPEYVRTASGRIIRSMNSRPIHESDFESYQNSEIDDSDHSSEYESDDSSHSDRGTRRRRGRPRRDSARMDTDSPPVRRGRPPNRVVEEDDLVVVPIRMNAQAFIERVRSIQSGRRQSASPTCALCGAPELLEKSNELDLIGFLLGPFPISDIGDCFFHEECLFTLSKLRLVPQHSTRVSWNATLTFANLDRLVNIARTEGKCFVCKSMGAGIKCCRCRKVVHYLCSRRSAMERDRPLFLDPALDGFFVCHTCELPREAAGLIDFSVRPRWRRKESARDWLVAETTRPNIMAGVYVPQIGDAVYYYPPKIPPGESSAVTTVCVPGGSSTFQALTDLSLLSWWNNPHGYVAGRVESIEYKFPSFFDAEIWSLYQVLTIVVTGSSNDVNTFEGFRFRIHYRPKMNGSDFIVPQLRVDRYLASGYDRRAKSGEAIDLLVKGEDGEMTRDRQTIFQVNPDMIRPGWECFRIKLTDPDGTESTQPVSLWELDVRGVDIGDPITLVPGISNVKVRFLSGWLGFLLTGTPYQNNRNRIDIESGMNTFASSPSNSPGLEGYSEFIEYPMYMSLIKDRLDGGYYRHMEELRKDVMLISINCERYNGPSSVFVSQAQKLVAILIKLLDMNDCDHELCMPPRVPSTRASTEPDQPLSGIRIRTSANSRTSVDALPVVSSVTVNRMRTLVCDHCGARRQVDFDVYNRFKGKKIKCSWIHFVCEDVDESPVRTTSRPSRAVSSRPKRQKRRLRGRRSDDASSSLTEDSDESDTSMSDSDESDESDSISETSTPRATRRSSRISPNKRTRRR